MRVFRQSEWLLGCWLWVCGLVVAVGGGCQLEPNLPPAPMPYYPKDVLQLIPSKSAAEYTLSDDAAALKTAKDDIAVRAK